MNFNLMCCLGGVYDAYNCTFPAMIADWRVKWSESTSGQTPNDFPFGFVQLNSIGNSSTYDDPVDPDDNADGLSSRFGCVSLFPVFVGHLSLCFVTNSFAPAQPNQTIRAKCLVVVVVPLVAFTFGSYAGLRWSQTAAQGYVPNAAMPNVFMATSLDTPDRPYPFTGINGVHDAGFNVHSPFKQPVAARLARSGLVQA